MIDTTSFPVPISDTIQVLWKCPFTGQNKLGSLVLDPDDFSLCRIGGGIQEYDGDHVVSDLVFLCTQQEPNDRVAVASYDDDRFYIMFPKVSEIVSFGHYLAIGHSHDC